MQNGASCTRCNMTRCNMSYALWRVQSLPALMSSAACLTGALQALACQPVLPKQQPCRHDTAAITCCKQAGAHLLTMRAADPCDRPMWQTHVTSCAGLQVTAKLFQRVADQGVPPAVLPALGGFVTGMVALQYPEVLYQGFGNVNAILQNRYHFEPPLLFQILAVKILCTSVSKGAGLVGGTYAPSIFMGKLLIAPTRASCHPEGWQQALHDAASHHSAWLVNEAAGLALQRKFQAELLLLDGTGVALDSGLPEHPFAKTCIQQSFTVLVAL